MLVLKKGCWEPCIKYIEKNCITYFLCMHFTVKNLLATVALNDCYEATILSRYRLVSFRLRKWLK